MFIVRIFIILAFCSEFALAAEKSAVLSVSNMTCALCPLTVRSAISQVPGVISVDVDRDRAQATVKYDDATATTDAIAAASSNAGYPATVVKAQ